MSLRLDAAKEHEVFPARGGARVDALLDVPISIREAPAEAPSREVAALRRDSSSTSLRDVACVLMRRRSLAGGVLGGLRRICSTDFCRLCCSQGLRRRVRRC